jgi:S-adenosyl methyltransferase
MARCPVNDGVVLAVVMAVVLPLALAEFGDWSPWLAQRLVRWAAQRLPDPASRSRYEEEWTANLNQVPGKLAPLFAAAGYLVCLPAMRHSVRRPAQTLPASADPSAAQGRTVLYLASYAGIRQFLDITAGTPATVRTHELAWTTSPESRIFYAADNPAWLPPALPQAYLPESALAYVTADLRDPGMILRASIETLDFSRPIVVLLRGLLGHVGDQREAQAIASYLMQAMPSGSYLVLNESTGVPGDQNARRDSADSNARHLPARIAGIIDGLELVDPSHINSAARELLGTSDLGDAERDTFCVVARKS